MVSNTRQTCQVLRVCKLSLQWSVRSSFPWRPVITPKTLIRQTLRERQQGQSQQGAAAAAAWWVCALAGVGAETAASWLGLSPGLEFKTEKSFAGHFPETGLRAWPCS